MMNTIWLFNALIVGLCRMLLGAYSLPQNACQLNMYAVMYHKVKFISYHLNAHQQIYLMHTYIRTTKIPINFMVQHLLM